MKPESAYPHITRTPGVCGGRPCVAGHRIRVQDIAVIHEQQGLSAEEICQQFPGITLGEVYAALAYYFDHRPEIQADIQEAETLVESFRRQHPDQVA